MFFPFLKDFFSKDFYAAFIDFVKIDFSRTMKAKNDKVFTLNFQVCEYVSAGTVK